MKLTETDKRYLIRQGYLDRDMEQIEKASAKTICECGGQKISLKTAEELLGRNAFLSALSRSAFHRSAGAETEDGREIDFDSSKFFRESKPSRDFRLLGMNFTLICDREISEPEGNPYRISPGAYELANGKRFDFFNTVGCVDPKERTDVLFEVSELDDCSDVITKADLKQTFKEFFVYTGEPGEPEVGIREVRDVSFEVCENGAIREIHATKEQLESINRDIQERYRWFLEDGKGNPK